MNFAILLSMQVKRLKEISKISLGYSFRVKIEHKNNGNMLVVSAKDIKDNFIISNSDHLTKISHPIYEDRLVKKDDILLSNRGYFKAGVFSLEKNTIAASSVYILRIKKDVVLPEYLVIWINSKKGQNEINKNTTGTMIKTILKSELENIKIEIPIMEKQEKIIELNKIKIELKDKLKKKEQIFENIFQGTLSKTINK